MNRLIICTILLALVLIGCGKNNPPDEYIILYNDAKGWTYAAPTESGHNQSLKIYASRKKAIQEAWKYFEWKKERINKNNWHEYKENK